MTERRLGLFVVLCSVVALAIAWWAEHELGMVPCALCLWERWPWRIAFILGALAATGGAQGRTILWLCCATMVAGIGLSVLHAGVEQGWWQSPLPECQAPHFHGGTFAERLASMPARPAKPCDAPAYLFGWLPVSMTVLGGAYALMVMIAVVAGLGRVTRNEGGLSGTR